ncbi:MAG: mnmH [Flavipsychrobacter sp.]|nr:mnmH [Flavipsychrobacter sp.]
MIQSVNIDEFLSLAKQHTVLDVRSPGEYAHAHIRDAYNVPLFSDEERKMVGTAYKQQSREDAIKIGLDYYGPKMRQIVEQAETIIAETKFQIPNSKPQTPKTVLLHCWRGGMRSQAIAWLLDLYGFRVYVLKGGYKAYRNRILAQFELTCPLHIVGGYSGSGKTQVLHRLKASGYATIDLEAIAQHKGSAFGALGHAQPTQEMFENLLGQELHDTAAMHPGKAIWIEDESRRIGQVNLPDAFWNTLLSAPVYFLDVPFEERLGFITAEYKSGKKPDLVNGIMRIQKRLGGLNTKNAINYLLEDNYTECFRILLHYYDKYYSIGLYDRKKIDEHLHSIPCSTVNATTNSAQLIAKQQTNEHTHTGN